MHTSIFTALVVLTCFAEKISAFTQFPTQCQSVCASLAEVSDQCEDLVGSDDNSVYASCVCEGPGATQAIPLCAACIQQNQRLRNPNMGYREWSANDAERLRRRCGIDQIRSYNMDNLSSTIIVTADTSVVSAFADSTATSTATATTTTSASDDTIIRATNSQVGNSVASPTASPTSSSPEMPNTASTFSVSNNGLSFTLGVGLLLIAAML